MFRVDPGGLSGVAEFDICQLFGNRKLYVYKLKYPPPLPGLKSLPSSDPTLKNLSHDIHYALYDSGLPMVLNGSNVGCHRMEGGKSKSKKTMICMSLTNGQCCAFKVAVKWDNKGFYTDTKCSVSAHKFHPMVSADCMHIPTRLIPMED
eukprot:3251775-Ditylum_brightwellii.AAC.1